jgi:hypothetical protein
VRAKGLADAQAADPENAREDREGHPEPADVGGAALEDLVTVAQEDQGEGDPEGAKAREGAVAEVIASLHLLEPGHELGEPPENDGEGEHGPNAAPAHIVELEHERGKPKTGQADHGGISELGLRHGSPFSRRGGRAEVDQINLFRGLAPQVDRQAQTRAQACPQESPV